MKSKYAHYNNKVLSSTQIKYKYVFSLLNGAFPVVVLFLPHTLDSAHLFVALGYIEERLNQCYVLLSTDLVFWLSHSAFCLFCLSVFCRM